MLIPPCTPTPPMHTYTLTHAHLFTLFLSLLISSSAHSARALESQIHNLVNKLLSGQSLPWSKPIELKRLATHEKTRVMVLRLLEVKLGVRTPDVLVMSSGMYVVPKVSTCIPISMFPALVTTLYSIYTMSTHTHSRSQMRHSSFAAFQMRRSPRDCGTTASLKSAAVRGGPLSVSSTGTPMESTATTSTPNRWERSHFMPHWENPLSPPLEWVSFHWRGSIPILNTECKRIVPCDHPTI